MWICLFYYDMNIWYADQNTYANRVVLVFVHIVYEIIVGQGSHLCAHRIWNHSWLGESLTYVDWSSHSIKPHAYCILIFWWVLPYNIFVMIYLRNFPKKPKTIFVYIFLIVVLSRVCILNVIYLVSCWTHPFIIIFFKLITY